MQQMWKRINWHYIVIFLAASFAHAIMLLNDGVFADGWLLYSMLKHRDWEVVQSWFLEASMPASLYLHWSLAHLPNFVFWYRVLSFSIIVAAGCVVYLIGNSTGFVSRSESLAIAVIAATYPAYTVATVLVWVASDLYLLFFLVAAYLAIKSIQTAGLKSVLLRISALVLFLVSFIVNSLLVFYFGFLCLFLLVLYTTRLKGLPFRQLVTRLGIYHLDFLLWPFVYWMLRPVFFPRHGLYTTYNEFQLSASSFLTHTLHFFDGGIRQCLSAVITFYLSRPDILLVLLLVSFWLYAMLQIGSARFAARSQPYGLLAFGVVLLSVAIFPYVAVGKSPQGNFSNRHSLLLELPMSIIIVAAVRILFSNSVNALSRIGFTSLVLLVFAFGVALNQNYMLLHARWIENRAIMANLEQMNQASYFSFYWVEDRALGMMPHALSNMEWSGTFKEVWGGETRTAVSKPSSQYPTYDAFVSRRKGLFIPQRLTTDFDPAGCQATMTITPGHASYKYFARRGSKSELVVRYLIYKYFKGPDELDRFLLDLVDIRIEATEAPQAFNCPYDAADNLQRTLAIYDQLIAFKPRWAEAYYDRSMVYRQQGDLQRAISDLDQSIALKSNWSLPYKLRGQIHRELGALEEARADFAQAAKIDYPKLDEIESEVMLDTDH